MFVLKLSGIQIILQSYKSLINQKSGNSSGINVYLIHSLPLGLSAVQVFVGDKMAVVAHTGTQTFLYWSLEGKQGLFRYFFPKNRKHTFV
jgi:hypothetical protein